MPRERLQMKTKCYLAGLTICLTVVPSLVAGCATRALQQPAIGVGTPSIVGARPLPSGYVNSIGGKLVLIRPGRFDMGSPASEAERKMNEPQHTVILTKHFYMGAYEVTQAEWKTVMGSNPSYFKGDKLPVEMVSWIDCQAFFRKLTERDRKAKRIPVGWAYRLPTESEREYACRAGTTTPFHYGHSLDSSQANIKGDGPYGKGKKGVNREKTMPVGSFKPNAWGLYDMHGNVYEWCHDYWGVYPTGTVTDPVRTNVHIRRIYRGGAWRFPATTARSAKRSQRDPAKVFDFMGFRYVLAEGAGG